MYCKRVRGLCVTVGLLWVAFAFAQSPSQLQDGRHGFEKDGVASKAPDEIGLRWEDDILVSTDALAGHLDPAITCAPDGTLYIAVQANDESPVSIKLYRSTNGGATWHPIGLFSSGVGAEYPSLAYASRTNGDEWILLGYVANQASGAKDVKVARINANTLAHATATAASGIVGVSDLRPRVCTDNRLFDFFYVYVTYTVNAIDYYPVMFTRSTNQGQSFETPQNLTAGSETSGFETRPDIDYGSAGLVVAFEKPGWSGSVWSTQVWVTRSDNFGVDWTSPLQLTSSDEGAWHPSVAVAVDVDSVVVAYTYDFGPDTDIRFSYSADGGDSYSNSSFPWTTADEKDIDLTSSSSAGRFHGAFFRANEIRYTWADVSDPVSWQNPTVGVNDTSQAWDGFAPAICTDPTRSPDKESCIAWNDHRSRFAHTFFDAAYDTTWFPGDLNCDGVVDFADINAFVAALQGRATYEAAYPGCNWYNADINDDGQVDFADINPFVAILSS